MNQIIKKNFTFIIDRSLFIDYTLMRKENYFTGGASRWKWTI